MSDKTAGNLTQTLTTYLGFPPRQMRYIPNAKEVDELLPDKQYLNGHTDFGLVTLLFAQIVQG